jgi:hypothetical protein
MRMRCTRSCIDVGLLKNLTAPGYPIFIQKKNGDMCFFIYRELELEAEE